MALNNGATPQEIVETLLHIAPYAGFPACWEGLTVTRKVLREQGEGQESIPGARTMSGLES
jgi:4-carboxymuconolactone decarboxylase